MSKLSVMLKGLGMGALVFLYGCSTVETGKKPVFSSAAKSQTEAKVQEADGPPLEELDVSLIPNAIPKIEPFSKYGNPPLYEVFGKRYRTMAHNKGYQAKGTASWYGRKFHGQKTSSGEPYDMFGMTAAHRSLPLPTYAKVKNLDNGKEVIVKINDRGPFVHNRLIDLSYAAAKKLGLHLTGTAKVHVTAIDPSSWHKQQKIHLAKASSPKNSKTANNKIKQKATQLALNQAQKGASKKAPASLSKSKPLMVAAMPSTPAISPGKSLSKIKTTPTLAKVSKQLYIQLGSFNQKLNAQQLANKAVVLTQALNHVDVHIFPQKLSNKELYKVRVGPLRNKAEAQKLQKEWVALNKAIPATLIYE